MELKENDTIEYVDGNKYWIVKKILIENLIFYQTIKIGNNAKNIVFVEKNGLEIVEDEEVLAIVSLKIIEEVNG